MASIRTITASVPAGFLVGDVLACVAIVLLGSSRSLQCTLGSEVGVGKRFEKAREGGVLDLVLQRLHFHAHLVLDDVALAVDIAVLGRHGLEYGVVGNRQDHDHAFQEGLVFID